MKRLIVVAGAQVVVMLAWAAQNEYVRATAPTFRIPLQPRDPYDVLRGRYFVMNPKDSSIRTGVDAALSADSIKGLLKDGRFFGNAQVGFCRQGDVHRVCAVAPLGPTSAGPAQHWSRAHVSIYPADPPVGGYLISIDLKLDRFFLPNRATLPGRENEDGWEVEVAHRPGNTLLPVRLFFRGQPVDVGSGAIITRASRLGPRAAPDDKPCSRPS